MPKKLKELVSGYTYCHGYGATYHFNHTPLKEAKRDDEIADSAHVVETINWTLADKKTVHRNRYFAMNLSDAIGLAARISIAAQEVAEKVVSIRPASPEEIEEALAAHELFVPEDCPAVEKLDGDADDPARN